MLLDELKKEYADTINRANSLYEKLEQYRELQDSYEANNDKLTKIEESIILALKEDSEYTKFVGLAEEYDVENIIWENEDRLTTEYKRVHEDDGTLHVQVGELRFCFISNQEITKAEWNKEARPIVKAFGLSWSELK